MSKAGKTIVAALCCIMAGGIAAAQEASQPSETTETFASWTVRCRQPAPEAPRVCEVVHAVQGQGGVLAQIAIGTPPGGAAPLIVVQTPLGVLVSQPVTIGSAAAEGGTAPAFSLPFATCLQTGCIAQAETTHDALDALARDQTASFAFAERTGRAIEIAVPLAGLRNALARLGVQ